MKLFLILLLLTWTDNSGKQCPGPQCDQEQGFYIWKRINPGSYPTAPYAIVGTDIQQYFDPVNIPGSYCYQVSAFNQLGESAGTQEQCATIIISLPAATTQMVAAVSKRPPVTTLPSDLAATKVSATSIRLNWIPPTDPRVGFIIVQVSVNGGAYAADPFSGELPPNTSSWTRSGLGPGTYRYRLRIWDKQHVSLGFSNETTAIVL